MTTKRWLASIACFAGLLAVGLGIAAMPPPTPGVTKANFDRISIGMTETEVEEIFGGPGGLFDWHGKGVESQKFWLDVPFQKDKFVLVVAWISFADDRVTSKEWTGRDETVFEKLRRWLRF